MATGSPRVISLQLRNSREKKNFPIFLWQKSPGEYSDRSSQSQSLQLNPSPALPEFSQGTHLWGQRGGRKSLSGLFPKKAWGFARQKGREHWIIKVISTTINPTVLAPCLVSCNHAVSWPRRSFSSIPALIYVTKEHTGKTRDKVWIWEIR